MLYRDDKYSGELKDHPVVLLLSFKIGGPSPHRVSGRDLYRYMGVCKNYSGWINDRIKVLGLIENTDYNIEWFKSDLNGHSIEHMLTQFAAIEIVMSGRGELSRLVRRSAVRRDGTIRFKEND
ncbi:putative antirepressor protein [Erwinia phage vB_EamM_Yoloswag]|uniref:Putative antirepressor protein n=1 Tax=Erwinia phage vB_EamM_Yoloswag TaxID=1958956 RepID=A0A1S6L2V8_9CAUD|nr:anti-repressor Ant [Erwinia phage vB_EamM_Yoloswag]AQT28512.1 putative antirepressor protein [Erwinia phage vB_EamM_Yoloswag]